MRKAVLSVLVFLSLSFAGQTAEDAGEDARERARDGVRTYAVPELDLSPYSHTGRWEAEVEVEPDGRVGAIHPLTDIWFPEMNVAKWTFIPLGGTQIRWHRVTIFFDEDVDSLEPPSLAARYESPFTLHVWRRLPLINHLPRVDGRIPEKRCEVHDEVMQVELLPIYTCGGPPLPTMDGVSVPLQEVPPRELFPNVYDSAGPFADRSVTKAEVYICASCRKARDAWRAAHPVHPSVQ